MKKTKRANTKKAGAKKTVGKRKSVADFFKENYSKSWQYIKESRKFIWLVAILFVVSILIGVLYQPPVISNSILDYIRNLLTKTGGMSVLQIIGFIFVNNVQTGLMGFVFGFVFGIFPVITTIANGYVIGYVSSSAVAASGWASLLDLLPHGIFEIPAIFLSFAMGIKFGTFMFYKEKTKYFSRFFMESLRVFVFVVIPLLIIAAIIEGSLIFIIK